MERRQLMKNWIVGMACTLVFGVTVVFLVNAIAFPKPGGLAQMPALVFFTIQSNIAVALWIFWIGLSAYWPRVCAPGAALSLWLTVYITLTGVVYWAVLVPMLGGVPSLFTVSNLWLHTATPVFSLFCFMLVLRGRRIEWRRALIVFAYPAAYLGFSYGMHAVYGRYTYPFLNPQVMGAWGVAVAIVVVAALLAALTALLRRWWNRHCMRDG